MILRLILGDQLNHNHSWFKEGGKDTIYFMAEMRQETDYARHHIQKIVAFFQSMRNFADSLINKGCNVTYFELDHKDNKQNLVENLRQLIQEKKISKFEYQLPDEYRLDEQLTSFCDTLEIETEVFNTEHFLTSRADLATFFDGKKQYTMEYFYRYMRKRYDIMMVTKKDPEGGKWNFDQTNRKKWNGTPGIPNEKRFQSDVTEIVNLIRECGVKTIGNIVSDNFNWPTSREESLEVLNYFCENLLPHFGDYQDAMHPDEKYLFHSRISFALNVKLLHPLEVMETVISYWRDHKDEIDISQVEGFVRQILGWREYMRGIYWMQMPEY